MMTLLLHAVPCFSQTSQSAEISGNITDASGKRALVNANIVLSEKNLGTLSDGKGNYLLNDIPPGAYTLNVSFVGYRTYRKKIELKKNERMHLNIYLKDTVISSGEVQIVGEKNRDLTELSNRVNIIKCTTIESAPVQNIHELLDYTPGVNLSNPGGIFSSKAVVTLRGLPASDQSRTLVVMDGVPLNKSDEGSVNWNMINKNSIEKVVVIKGPGPAKYGSGAMGGVIELFTKKPAKKLDGSVAVSYGTYNTMSSSLNLQGIIKPDTIKKKYYWGINASARKSDGYISEPIQFLTAADSILAPVFLKEINTGLKAGCDIGKNQNIELQFGFFDDMRGNGVKIYDNYGAWQQHLTYKGLIKYSGHARYFKWNSIVYGLKEKYFRMYEYLKDGDYMLYQADSKRSDMGGDFSLSCMKFSSHEITAGASCRFGSVDGTDTYYTSTDVITNKAAMDEYSFYVQDEMRFMHEKLTVNAGLRYDVAKFHNGLFTIDKPSYSIIFYKEFENLNMADKFWDELCPRFSAGYQLSETARVYASVAKGFRAPILDDMCRTGKKKGGFKVANPDLGPEKLITYECGADAGLMKGLTAGISVFYNTGLDFMYYVSNGDTVNMGYKLAPVVQKENIGKVEIYGTELEFMYTLKENISVFANYSFTHAQIIEHRVNNPLVDSSLTGKFLTDIPNHKVSAGFTWRNKVVNASLLYKYIGRVWINDLNRVPLDYFQTNRYPDYGIFSISLEKRLFKMLSLNLNVENIFNKIYFDSELQQCPGRFITGGIKFIFSTAD
ncbi:MAG: TonB-dependent receptor [Bacteroidota bacterium]